MKAIVILLDTVRRDFLSFYDNGSIKAHTPNLDRLREKSVVFDKHWTGSLPCMPARHDMFTGRINFLERNWGPIEPFDDTLPQILRRNGIYTHICTDHYHYFEIGAENYCQSFDTWDLIRGQEDDPWISQVNPVAQKHPAVGKMSRQYALNRGRFRKEADYPTPRTFQSAVDWIEANHQADKYLLWIEAFDPHEPFDVPDSYLQLYGDTYTGSEFIWPEYKPCDLSDQELQHIVNRYCALLTMTDHWIGKLLDTMDRHKMWDDTMVIFTTDHGFLFGEHGHMAKNYMPMYNEINHLPLLMHLPHSKYAGTRIDALTQNIDILPTLLDHFGAAEGNKPLNRLHGRSWMPLVNGTADRIRDYALYGYFGKNVNITDGTYTYFRTSGREDNAPISIYTAMPTTFWHYLGNGHISDFKRIETGRFLKWTDFPVYKFDGSLVRLKDKSQAFNCMGEFIQENLLFDIKRDYRQMHPLTDPELENAYMELMRRALAEHDSPDDQYTRLGLD